jgi:hypothetical protein
LSVDLFVFFRDSGIIKVEIWCDYANNDVQHIGGARLIGWKGVGGQCGVKKEERQYWESICMAIEYDEVVVSDIWFFDEDFNGDNEKYLNEVLFRDLFDSGELHTANSLYSRISSPIKPPPTWYATSIKWIDDIMFTELNDNTAFKARKKSNDEYEAALRSRSDCPQNKSSPLFGLPILDK